MSAQPIKRSKALMPLSREHHFDLLLAWKIRTGIGKGIEHDRIAGYIKYLDKHLIEAHFRDEEELLFAPFLPDDELCSQAMKEHEEIRKLTDAVCNDKKADDALFLNLADAIEAHVRFEERELFPYIEGKISKERLHELEKMIAASHENFVDQWEDTFWGK